MNLKPISILLLVFIYVVTVDAQKDTSPQTVTLYAPSGSKLDFSRATFNFERGKFEELNYDITYGYLKIDEDYWLSTPQADHNRSLIRNLGALNWNDTFEVPFIEPLPKLEEGKTRNFTIDSSGSTGKNWAKKNGINVKPVVGNLYVMHVKDKDSDFYVLFRVESIVPGESCTISWKIVDSPKQ